MFQIEHSVQRKSKPRAFNCSVRRQLIYLALCVCFIHTNDAFPNGSNQPTWQNDTNFRPRGNAIPPPTIAKSGENRTIAEVRHDYKSSNRLVKPFALKTNKISRRTPQFITAKNRPTPYTLPYWRSLMSKAWSTMTGWFRSPDKKLSRRKINTARQGRIASFVASAPLWAIPVATAGMVATFRDPLSTITNEIFAFDTDAKRFASSLPLSVSGVLQYFGLSSSRKTSPQILPPLYPVSPSKISSNIINSIPAIKHKIASKVSSASGDKNPLFSGDSSRQKDIPSVLIGTVTLKEARESGVVGELQLMQNLDSKHVMIMGQIKGLTAGIHGLYLQHGNGNIKNDCLNREINPTLENENQEDSEGKPLKVRFLGNIVTYPFEVSAIIFIIDDVMSLDVGSPSSILNGSFVVYDDGLEAGVACGKVNLANHTDTPQTQIVAVTKLVGANGSGVTGKLIFSQTYPSDSVTIIGVLYRLRLGLNKLNAREYGGSGSYCRETGPTSNSLENTTINLNNNDGEVTNIGSIVSSNNVGPTSVFIISESISLRQTSPQNILDNTVSIHSESGAFSPKGEKEYGITEEIMACGIVQICDTNCQKSLTLAGAEF